MKNNKKTYEKKELIALVINATKKPKFQNGEIGDLFFQLCFMSEQNLISMCKELKLI